MVNVTMPRRPLRLALFTITLLMLGPDPAAAGTWRWPLDGPVHVLRGFDPPAFPWGSGHRGVDLAARANQPVYAAGAGRIGYVGRIAGRGIVTVVHDSRRTTYLPVRATVRRAARVTAGQRIGTVQAGLRHCGTQVCLHWGLLRGAHYLDPLALLRTGPIRLLPLRDGTPTHVPRTTGPVATAQPEPTDVPSRATPDPRESDGVSLTGAALAGPGGAGLAVVALLLAGRAIRHRPVRRAAHRVATMVRRPGGTGPGAPSPHAPAAGRAALLARLRPRRAYRHRTARAAASNIIDLTAERRRRRPPRRPDEPA